MFRRDDAASTVETPSITSGTEASDSFPSTYTSQTDTRSGENVSTLLPPSISSVDTTSNPGYTITPSRTSIPSSTGRQLVVVETSTPPESHSFSTSTLGPSTAATTTLSDTVTSSTLLDTTSATTEGSISADIPSSTMLFYSIVTAANPIPTVAPASSISPSRTSVYSILPVSDSTTMSTSSPSLTSIYSILPVSDTTTISTPPPSSPSLTSIYSILPVSESTISSTPEVAPESQSSTLVYSILPVSDSTSTSESPTLAYSILPVALDTSTPTVVPVSTTSTLVYSIFPVSTSTTTTIISPTLTIWPSNSQSLTPNSPFFSVVSPEKVVYQSTTVPGAPITLSESRSSEVAPTAFSSSLSSSASVLSSQRINNLALQPTADPGVNSLPVTVITSGSITRTFVVHPTVGITGVGGAPGVGEGRGLSSGDTRSHPKALPIILGSVFGCVAMILLLLLVVCRRKRLRRWHRLPEPSFRDVYEPALDASRHSSRFLNPFLDIDDDWSIIGSERPASATTTSTLAFAPSHGDGDDVGLSSPSGNYTPWEIRQTPTLSFFARARSGGWLSPPR